MKNVDLKLFGIQEMNTMEMQETNGGVLLLVLACCGVALLASSCISSISIQIGTNNTTGQGSTQVADSTLNGNTFDVPIGY